MLPIDALGACGDAQNRGFAAPIEDNAGQHFSLGEGGATQNVVKLTSYKASNSVRPAVAYLFLSLLNTACERVIANTMQVEQ